MQHVTKRLTILCLGLAVLALSGCGTPAISVNPYNPGGQVAPAGTTTPTSIPVAIVPTMGSMPGMESPTSSAASSVGAQSATAVDTVTPGPSPTELVIDWLLYGSPTATPNAVAQSPQTRGSQVAVTPTSNTNSAQNGPSPTTSGAQNASPTITLAPPTATQPTVPNVTATTAGATVAAAASPAAATVGDPARGQALFQGAPACSSCHDVTAGVAIVGPSLKHIASIAGSQVPGQDASTRLHHAIMTPNEFLYPGFQPNIMPQTFAQTLSPQQIDDLVAYLLTLK